MLKKSEINKHRRAFMLLEVILSVFVVTVGVVFVISSFITSLKAFKVSKIYTESLYLLEQKLWDYEEKGKIKEEHTSGKFDDYKNAEWDIEAKELEDISLNETTAEIAIKEEDQKRYFRVITYFNKEE